MSKFSIDGEDESMLGKMNTVEVVSGTTFWKCCLYLVIIIVMLFFTSLITCVTNDECRNHIPTVNNMLNSTLVAPYIDGGLYASLGLHLLVVTGLYHMICPKFPYYAYMQLFFASCIYLSIIITMLVFPFTRWQSNWANLSILVSTTLWMTLVWISLFRYYRARPMSSKSVLTKFNALSLVLFFLCALIYIVLRSTHLHIVPKDDGILVVEIVGGLAFLAYMILCAIHIGSGQIQISFKE